MNKLYGTYLLSLQWWITYISVLEVESSTTEKNLYSALFTSYNNEILPRCNHADNVTVTLDMSLREIIALVNISIYILIFILLTLTVSQRNKFINFCMSVCFLYGLYTTALQTFWFVLVWIDICPTMNIDSISDEVKEQVLYV